MKISISIFIILLSILPVSSFTIGNPKVFTSISRRSFISFITSIPFVSNAVELPDSKEVPAWTLTAKSPKGLTQKDFAKLNGKRKSLNHDYFLVKDLLNNIDEQIIFIDDLILQIYKNPNYNSIIELIQKRFLIGKFVWPSRSTEDDDTEVLSWMPRMNAPIIEMFLVLRKTDNPVIDIYENINYVLHDGQYIILDEILNELIDIDKEFKNDLYSLKKNPNNIKKIKNNLYKTKQILQKLKKSTLYTYDPIFKMRINVIDNINENIDYFRQFSPNPIKKDE